jgi:hypothetical protein
LCASLAQEEWVERSCHSSPQISTFYVLGLFLTQSHLSYSQSRMYSCMLVLILLVLPCTYSQSQTLDCLCFEITNDSRGKKWEKTKLPNLNLIHANDLIGIDSGRHLGVRRESSLA